MYQYETHMHTYEASACGTTHAADYPAYYQSIGYAGIIITDHFYHGNTRIPRDLPWEDWVNGFCRGYEEAKAAGDAIGFPVFFGWEENFEGDEFLTYGLDREWLLAHPGLRSWTRTQYYNEVHAAGGLVVQAHPFRERGYLSSIHLNPENCDAWEGYNAFNEELHNLHAMQYATEHGIFTTAGSDLHKIGSKAPEGLFGMCFETPLNDIQDYVKRILAHEGTPRVPAEQLYDPAHPVDMTTGLPVYVNVRGQS